MGAYGIAGAAVSGGLGILNNLISYGINRRQAEEDRQRNFQLNELAAQNADTRTRALYNDFYSPSALIEQYKKAGLSPSMMYGGTPGQGGMSGAQGGGSGIQTHPFQPYSILEAAQVANLMEQAKKTRAETANIEKETEKTGAEIDNLVEDTGNKRLVGYNLQVQNSLMHLEEAFATDTYKTRVNHVNAEYDNLIEKTKLLIEETKKATTEAQISNESADSIIQYYQKRVIDISADIMVKQTQKELMKTNINLTTEQAKKVINDIIVDNANVELRGEELEYSRSQLRAQIEQWATQNGYTERGQNVQIANTILDFITGNNENFIKGLGTILRMKN